MENSFYDRTILILEELKGDELLESFLKTLESPLNLAKRLACEAFSKSSQDLKAYREQIDALKRMVLGLSSAESSAAKGDYLASYALYQFAFQQFFQSSLRARQGNVLDRALNKILSDNKITIVPKPRHKEELKKLGIETATKHDIDVFGFSGDKALIIQIRSRDDTGGTTAKGSLVELIEDIRSTGKLPQKPLIYLIYIWEPLDRQQRQALINKVGSALSLSDKQKRTLESGGVVSIGDNIRLGIMYGATELFQSIKLLTGISVDVAKYSEVINILSHWDDLWLSYATVTLELENLIIKGSTNFSGLDRLLKEEAIKIRMKDLLDYKQSSAVIAQKLALVWKESTIPFTSPSGQLNYIRDLVLLKMVSLAVRKLTYSKGTPKNLLVRDLFDGEYDFSD